MERAASKHNPNGSVPHFNNEAATQLIGRYQTQGSLEDLSAVLGLAQERVKTLIRFNGAHSFRR